MLHILYKLIHGAEYLQCSEMFVVGKSIIHLVLQKFVFFVNHVSWAKIKWPKGKDLVQIKATFKNFCGLPTIHSAMYTSFKSTFKNQEIQVL